MIKYALAILAGVMLWLAGVACWIAYGPPENARDRADTAIVLGAAVDGDRPSPVFAARAVTMANAMGFDAKASAAPTTRYRSWSTKAPFLLREVYFIHHYWVFEE